MIDIEAINISVSSDEDSYCYSFDAAITRPEDFNLFNPGAEANIIFYDITYKVIIDERSRSIEFNKRDYKISGRAITAKLGEGWSNTISKTWGAINASAVVTELCNEIGIVSEYLATDWLIPANTLSASSEYRIDVIRKIADACGAIIQTRPNGNLVILPKYKVEPPNIGTVTPDVLYGVHNDIIGVSESYDTRPKYNKVIVMDKEDASVSYNISEYVPANETGYCELAVKTYPFEDSIELLTSSDTLSITHKEKKVETINDEIIEIVNGEGSCSEYVKEVLSYEYIDNDLGALDIRGKNINTSTKGMSLLLLTYKTEFHIFIAQTSTPENPAQVYITD